MWLSADAPSVTKYPSECMQRIYPQQSKRLASGLMALIFALIAPVASTNAQGGQGIADTPQALSPIPISDTSDKENSGRLSLTKSAAMTSESGTGVLEEKTLSSRDFDEQKEHLRLRELDSLEASSQPQDPQCKPAVKENYSPRPAEAAVDVERPSYGQAPKTPTVSTLNGEITVDPGEASLREVVKAIQLHTGIAVEYPSGKMDERVFGVVGPASLREVLTKLLYGSGLNYIIQTRGDDTNEINKLVLSAQTPAASAASLHAAAQSPGEPKEGNAVYGSAGFIDESQAETVRVEPATPVVPAAIDVPGIPPGFNLKQAAAAANKSTAQLLDEMQKRQLEILDSQAPPPQ